ncbi:hypothetical protein PG996_012361 [Apiospora saccharicola]|uniref:FAD-binding PCMH-type domain-containing protein n=1 Tax=Apiospora saccharicola TaxID=335842 RepID=A0ABR1U4R3_9PEZI
MNKVTYDTAKKTITVGGGARYREIWTTAYNAKRELPLSSACVSVGGCTVGGGHGWLRGKYGLVIDAIVSVRVALWDGTIVTASETQNSDLFWVMRGAGQNFGIMLEFTMKTWPQTNGGKIYNADMSFTNKSLEEVLEEVLETINGPVHQTMHAVSSGIESASNLPPLAGFRTVGLLGARFYNGGGLLRGAPARQVRAYGDGAGQTGRGVSAGAECLTLGFTEIGLLLDEKDVEERCGCGLPLFDATKIHAVAAADWAMREAGE